MLACGLQHGTRHCQAEGVTAQQVRQSIEQGAQFLLNEQSPRGTWDEMSQYPGGVTGLCTLALLNAGVDVQDPKIQRSLDHLRNLQATKTYSVALQTMALCAAEPQRDLPLIQQNVDWLEETQIRDGAKAGAWSYPQKMGGDNSNSQFAVLALHEAERAGAEVSPSTWELAAAYWQSCQNPDGSWGYLPGYPGVGSMTCAGLGATVICSGKVASPRAKTRGDLVQCCLPQKDDDSLELAVAWLARNFSVKRNPGQAGSPAQWHFYYLYGLERVGRLTARRFVGEHDWYREGAEFLVGSQDAFDRSWNGSGHAENNQHITTALALLFLSKGRRPILMAKLKHEPENDWNNHPGDVAHLTAHVERRWGLDLTWQVFDPQTATTEDLMQAPVLFLSGSRRPQLNGQERKIRNYIDRGGFLFAEACCLDGHAFEQGLRQFLKRVFPEEEYRLRRAGPEHPLWRVDEWVRPESPYVGRLWTVEYGCRTCVVFAEVDLSCYWELYGQGRIGQYPQRIQDRLQDAMAIGSNVLAYATNRKPRGKEEAAFATPADAQLSLSGGRGLMRVAKLIHGGGCNDAPGALTNLLRAAGQGELKLRVDPQQYDLVPSDPSLPRFVVSFMHGRHAFQFTAAERDQLSAYLQNGGTLIADAICGSAEFADAFQREMAEVLPGREMRAIETSHPLFGETLGGFDIRRVKRREPATTIDGQPMQARTRDVAPDLEAIEIDGRLAVIFSKYDISCALEQHEALQCRGYTQQDAARIALNLLMYALNADVP